MYTTNKKEEKTQHENCFIRPFIQLEPEFYRKAFMAG